MSLYLAALLIIQGFSISLGVGSSTLAILNFFSAIADGKIDDTERRMMGIVYVVLRLAMILILFSTIALFFVQYQVAGPHSFSTLQYGQAFALSVLFINAILMTAHVMPSTFGPAIQAGNWFTLGFLETIEPLNIAHFSILQFLLAYITWIVLAIAVVNGAMALMKAKRYGFLKP